MTPVLNVRVRQPLRAFTHLAVDYGGPFIRSRKNDERNVGNPYLRAYQARAVNLEMAYGLGTYSFLRCFLRITGRRGYPLTIVSDCGTNFIGAERELRELVYEVDQSKI